MNTAVAVPSPSPSPSPSLLGGPRTPEGKARSAQNARRHGLRARDFGLAPDEDPAEWALHLAACERGYGPVDLHERNLVCAVAAAMWNEIRADRMLAEVMARMPPDCPGPSHGGDGQAPVQTPSPSTAIRYQTAAGMAVQRAQRTLLAYRKAVLDGLIVPQRAVAEPANENLAHPPPGTDEPRHAEPQRRNCTNELSPRQCEPGNCTGEPEDCTPEPGDRTPATANDTYEPGGCTDEPRERTQVPGDGTGEPGQPGRPPVPTPLAALRARLDRLLRQGAASSPGDRDLLAAMRGLKLPDAIPYRGPIDPALLDRVLAERRFELGGRAWLQGFAEPAGTGAADGRGSGRTG